jgi:hypothetical protein
VIADGDDAGDRNYLVLAKPNVIMNDIRLRGLAVPRSDAAGRKRPHNHAQTAQNLRRSLRNAAAGARLIHAEGLDSKSAAQVAASLADALEELPGSSAASIDVSDVTGAPGRAPPARSLMINKISDHLAARAACKSGTLGPKGDLDQ